VFAFAELLGRIDGVTARVGGRLGFWLSDLGAGFSIDLDRPGRGLEAASLSELKNVDVCIWAGEYALGLLLENQPLPADCALEVFGDPDRLIGLSSILREGRSPLGMRLQQRGVSDGSGT
ncbi:MAG: hypothetical protein AAF658_08165, partial [Myxococcota bacterium]